MPRRLVDGRNVASMVGAPVRAARDSTGHDLDRAVVVAVTIVGMVEVAVDQVADVVSVRHGLVATAGAVNMVGVVAAAGVAAGAAVRVRLAHLDHVLVHVVVVGMVQVTVVQIVDVTVVLDGGVAAVGAVNVVVVLVLVTAHDVLSLVEPRAAAARDVSRATAGLGVVECGADELEHVIVLE